MCSTSMSDLYLTCPCSQQRVMVSHSWCVFALQVSVVCVPQSTLSVCVLSVEQEGKRRAVGRVLFPLEGELGQAGRVLWRDLETEDDTQVHAGAQWTYACGHKGSINDYSVIIDVCQYSELGDVQISLSYSPALQRLSVVVLKARGLQLLIDAGM